ncbi:hypothetical protein ACU063_23825 [Paenibacillus sp. M.A.Huq-81]
MLKHLSEIERRVKMLCEICKEREADTSVTNEHETETYEVCDSCASKLSDEGFGPNSEDAKATCYWCRKKHWNPVPINGKDWCGDCGDAK